MLVALVALLQQATYTGILKGVQEEGENWELYESIFFHISNLQIVLYIQAWKAALQEKTRVV